MELLSPAGNLSKLKTALLFGADAVYFAGKSFGLRAKAGNFSLEEMADALEYLHSKGKKGYLAVNIYPEERELIPLKEYLKTLSQLNLDGLIVSDLGVFALSREMLPHTPIFISTQANVTNSRAANFLKDLGASRVILARETDKESLEEIIKNSRVDIEVFVHGAVCISYSGRCLMSAYLTGKKANSGECTQPCRWNYLESFVTEVTRPDAPMPIEEDERGTYLYNAKDLCLIARIGELYRMGIKSVKIEGRMKNEMYVAVTAAVYRQAIDKALKGEEGDAAGWLELLTSVSHRHYTEGFYAGGEDSAAMNYESSGYVRSTDFLGVVTEVSGGSAAVLCKGKFSLGERLAYFTPKAVDIAVETEYIRGGKDKEFTRAGEVAEIPCPEGVEAGAILRRVATDKGGGG